MSDILLGLNDDLLFPRNSICATLDYTSTTKEDLTMLQTSKNGVILFTACNNEAADRLVSSNNIRGRLVCYETPALAKERMYATPNESFVIVALLIKPDFILDSLSPMFIHDMLSNKSIVSKAVNKKVNELTLSDYIRVLYSKYGVLRHLVREKGYKRLFPNLELYANQYLRYDLYNSDCIVETKIYNDKVN